MCERKTDESERSHALLMRLRIKPIIIGNVDITIMQTVTRKKLSLTTGNCPNLYPGVTNKDIHNKDAAMLNRMKRLYFIAPTPATNGANVRMMGTNLAMITALPPCFS